MFPTVGRRPMTDQKRIFAAFALALIVWSNAGIDGNHIPIGMPVVLTVRVPALKTVLAY